MRLKKLVPARTETVKVNWMRRDFMAAGTFNDYRRKNKLSTTETCWWCHKRFEDDEHMVLASFYKRGANKLICSGCADEAEAP